VDEKQQSARSLTRRDRNTAAAELAYRTAGLPASVDEYSRVTKRSNVVNAGGRQSKPRGRLSALDTADFIVEDAMEHAIEAIYGKKRRRKVISDVKKSSTGETRSLDRQVRRNMRGTCDNVTLTENRELGRTINETTSTDESRKKAVSYVRVERDDDEEEDDEDFDLRRPMSADGRLTNRAVAVHGRQQAVTSKKRFQISDAARFNRRTTADLQRINGYSSETERKQVSRRRQHFSGDDSDFSTTVEVRSPRSTQFQTETDGDASDDSDTRNRHGSSSQSRVPTLTKGMVTKILHGDRSTAETIPAEARHLKLETASPWTHLTSSPPNGSSTPVVYHDSRHSAVVPVGPATDARPSALDDNFLLQRAPAYHVDVLRHVGDSGTYPRKQETDERPPSSYAAFSNEPIIVTSLDDEHTRMATMRRAQSLFSLDEAPLSSVASGRSQTPIFASRPDMRMANHQVLNLYLFNRKPDGEGRAAEMETVTRTMMFDEKVKRTMTGNKETQTPPKAKHNRKYIQTTQAPVAKPPKRRKAKPSLVTEEMVITKPSIIETRETEAVGDVFAEKYRPAPKEPECVRSSVTRVFAEPPQEEPEEEEVLETTVVEEKEQRIEMTIREDLEFSLQRSRATVAEPTDNGKVEPWWIPDKFEAFVERKRQKVTQTKDIENKDDHSKRIDVEYSARNSQDAHHASESNDYYNESDFRSDRMVRETNGNVRVPIFLENNYNSPMRGMTSPSANLVRTKMSTHSEPELNRRHQYYLSKRDKYYDSLFGDSRREPFGSNDAHSLPVTNRRQAADVPELRLEVVDDEDSGDSNSATSESRFAEKRYVSTYSQFVSPPLSSDGNAVQSDENITRHRTRSQSTGTRTVFPTSKIISLPNVEPDSDDGDRNRHDCDQFPESLDHFDRVLTEIEEELPPPPMPPSLPSENQRVQDVASQHRYDVKSSVTQSPAQKQKPQPPEKSWKRLQSGKLYSSQDHAATTTGVVEKQKSTASSAERRSAGSKTMENETVPTDRQKETGADFHRELGDHTYVSLSLTEPVQSAEQQRRRIAVVTHGQDVEPGGFAYGWTSQEHTKRDHAPQPGSFQLRHSRWTSDDYETAATAF